MRAVLPFVAGLFLVPACSKLPPSAYSSSAPPTDYGNVATPYDWNPAEGSSMPPIVQCADRFHSDRPGGRDYVGLPMPGCPPSP